MPAQLPTVQGGRLVAAAGLLASAVLILTGCGGADEAVPNADSDAGPPATAPMDTPTPEMTDETPSTEDDDVRTPDEAASETEDADQAADLAPGIYRDYSEDALAEPGYQTRVIFFHASWCPECRAFEQSIEAGPVPNGVQILKADYDTETELKQRYGVGIQTTFVKVDEDGEMISSWIGYQQDRSVDNLLDQLG